MNKISIGAALSFVVLLGAAAVAWDEIRPFPTRSEHEQVAGRSCENMLSFLSSERRDIERSIAEAKKSGNSSWLITLREQLRQVKEQISRVKKECGFS